MAGNLVKALQYLKIVKNGVTTPAVKGEIHIGRPLQAEMFAPSGDDSPPLPDDLLFFSRNAQTGGMVYLGMLDQGNAPEAEPGERRIYSRDSAGAIAAVLWLKGDGSIEVGGSADFAVRYTALETAFNQLKSDFDAHTGHFWPTNVAPPASTADITGAKVSEVKLP